MISQRLFEEAVQLITEIRNELQETPEARLIKEATTDALILSVFSSNYIECVGLNLNETIKICRRIFDGEAVDPDEVPDNNEEYQRTVEAFIDKKIKALSEKQKVVRSRREVIQHVKSMEYLIENFLFHNKAMSEDMVNETHRILKHRIDNHRRDGSYTPYKQYAGKYRDVPVHAGSTNFAVPQHIPTMMKRMVAEFNAEIVEPVLMQELDPFRFAAKYSDHFVQTHLFEDGNGRVSRLILNAVLIKYAGTTIEIGGDDDARELYLGIMRRSSDNVTGARELAGLVLRKSVQRLREFRNTLTRGCTETDEEVIKKKHPKKNV